MRKLKRRRRERSLRAGRSRSSRWLTHAWLHFRVAWRSRALIRNPPSPGRSCGQPSPHSPRRWAELPQPRKVSSVCWNHPNPGTRCACCSERIDCEARPAEAVESVFASDGVAQLPFLPAVTKVRTTMLALRRMQLKVLVYHLTACRSDPLSPLPAFLSSMCPMPKRRTIDRESGLTPHPGPACNKNIRCGDGVRLNRCSPR